MLCDNLVAMRNLEGLSQEQLAEKIGVSRQAYAKWEKGTSMPDIERCLALAEHFGTTVEEMMKDRKTERGTRLLPSPKGKYIFGTVAVNDRGQIVIPKAARDLFGFKSGDRLVVLGAEGEGIALQKAEVFEEMLQKLLAAAEKKGK